MKKLTEEDIKYRYITPAIEESGWKKEQVFMEYFFTDGQVLVRGNTVKWIGNNHPRRVKILTELLLLDFSLIILIADKQAFYNDSPLTEYKSTFVKFLHQKLYNRHYLPMLSLVP